MEDIKELMKRAKKEEKKNPDFLYQLGLLFKNGDGVAQNEGKAAKYFEKAADLGHVQGQIENAIRWWKHYNSYYYANLYLQKAIAQGSNQASEVLLEMQETMESKENPAYLYREGLKFLNGENCAVDGNKATEYLYKSGKMGYEKAKLEYGRYFSERFYSSQAENWLNELVSCGNEEANKLLEALILLKPSKPSGAATLDSLYEDSSHYKDPYTVFLKNHSLIRCPACKARLKEISQTTKGQLTKKMVTVFDMGTSFERRTDPYDEPTAEGQTITQTYECKCCKLSFDKTIHTRYEKRDKQDSVKEMITMTGEKTEWWTISEISYHANSDNVGKEALKILKKSEGKFENKSF